jgi:DNA-binding MarR family transcriptional regulator
VFLTARGKEVEDELCLVAERVQDKVNASLTPEELATLVRLLEKLRR